MPAKKKLPGLEPIHYIDVVNQGMMNKWLSNKNAHRAWEDAADSVTDNMKDVVQLQDLTYKPSLYKELDPLLVGKTIKQYVDLVLSDWTERSDDDTAKQLVASLPLFVEMSKSLPHVNPSEEYKYAFRGTNISDKVLKQFINNNPKPSDWAQTSIGSTKYMAYTGPKKNMFVYKPHRQVQSWSTSDVVATLFSDSIIATPLDLSFFFDPTFMNQYGFKSENETLHFGKEPMKVALLVDKEFYERLQHGGPVSDKPEWSIYTPSADSIEYYGGSELMYHIDAAMSKRGKFNWYDKNKKDLQKERAKVGDAEFNKKWSKFFKGLLATSADSGIDPSNDKYYMKYLKNKKMVQEANQSIQETEDVQDEDGTLTLPL